MLRIPGGLGFRPRGLPPLLGGGSGSHRGGVLRPCGERGHMDRTQTGVEEIQFYGDLGLNLRTATSRSRPTLRSTGC